jgi:hypothetical protein
MENGKKRVNVCSSLGLASATVSTFMVHAEKIKPSAQKFMNLPSSNVRYTRNFNIEKIEPLLILWVDDLNQKEFLSLSVILLQKTGSFWTKFNKKRSWKQDFHSQQKMVCNVQAKHANSLHKNSWRGC